MSPRAAVSAALLLAAPAAALAAQTAPQRLFTERLLADRATSAPIRTLLREDGGFVDRAIVFRDLTGDDKADAVVRVQSGGPAGAVAVYVFSTDGAGDDELRVVYRAQRLARARTSIRSGVLSVATAVYEPGDPIESPARIDKTILEWDAATGALLEAPQAP